MAVRAARAHVFEDQAHMAFGARNFGVHAAERITCLVMIELGVGANRLPACVGVAFLTWNRDWTVRIGDLRLRAANGGARIVRRLFESYAHKNGEQSCRNRNEPTIPVHSGRALH